MCEYSLKATWKNMIITFSRQKAKNDWFCQGIQTTWSFLHQHNSVYLIVILSVWFPNFLQIDQMESVIYFQPNKCHKGNFDFSFYGYLSVVRKTLKFHIFALFQTFVQFYVKVALPHIYLPSHWSTHTYSHVYSTVKY